MKISVTPPPLQFPLSHDCPFEVSGVDPDPESDEVPGVDGVPLSFELVSVFVSEVDD
jgi:hypothetical protein